MSMKVSDSIRGPSRGSMGQANAYAINHGAANMNDVEQLIRELYRLGALYGIDAAILVAQSSHETASWTAPLWKAQRNPAGLGAFDDGTYVGGAFPNGTIAAQAQFAHMLAYLGIEAPADMARLDPRYSAVRPAGFWGSVKKISDLGSGRWATDTQYAGKLVSHGNAIFPGIDDQFTVPEEPPMALTFGNVKHPPFVDLIVNNTFWNDLGQRRPIGVCQHSMVGTLRGSYTYILPGGGGQALWDYSVGGATDGANDGVIWRHNDPRGRRAGWANGGSDGLEGDGPLFVRTLGIDAINRDLVSIERSDGGNYSSQPMSPKQFESIAQLTAYWFDQARVPWDRFPFNPNVGCVTHMIHKEFATKDCPFPPVYNEITRLQDRVRAILKAAQTAAVDDGTELPPDKPIEQDHDRYPNGWKPADLKDQWGVLPRINPGGSVTSLHFAVTKNPIAAIANAWVHRGAADGITNVKDLPKPQLWQVNAIDDDTKSDLITFEGGRDAWQLWRPNKWVPWTWIDEAALKAKAKS